MSIIFNEKARRSTHVESGLAVQLVREEPPTERQTHFKIIANGREYPFVAYRDFGEAKLKENYPNMDPLEFNRRIADIFEQNFEASDISGDFDRDIFVHVWHKLVSTGMNGFRVTVRYTESARFCPSAGRTWNCEG